MSSGIVFEKDFKVLEKNFSKYLRKIKMNEKGGIDELAKVKCALQLLNWSVNGSPNASVVPPIKDGILRGSGSVFVGSSLAGDTKINEGTPNKSFNGKPDELTIGYNTDYAANVHENWGTSKMRPGAVSLQSGDSGRKWLITHMKKDGKMILELYAKLVRKELNVL